MTWSLVHTIADPNNAAGTGTAEGHQAMQYLFDTLMPTKGFTVAAHPSALAYRRKFTYTFTNVLTGGTPYVQYYWADWSAVLANNLTWYEDATYTTTKGDLCNAGQAISVAWNSDSYSTAGKPFKFWTSDQNSNAFLVTKGFKTLIYWPGYSSAHIYGDPTLWTAGTHNPVTALMPVGSNGIFYCYNAPIQTGSSGQPIYIHPSMVSGYRGAASVGKLFKNFDMICSNSAGGPDGYAVKMFALTDADVVLAVPPRPEYQRSFNTGTNLNGSFVKIGANYYLGMGNSMDYPHVLLDFGTSQPSFL